MTCLYVVRCNFADAALLPAWEHWYSGEKQDWLLSRPGFLAGQRFAAESTGDGVRFLALYLLESPAALQTPEYQSGWGWGNWNPQIIDWSRNFFEGVDPAVFLTHEHERLQVVFADVEGDSAPVEQANPGLTWVHALPGLDASLTALGLARLGAEDAGSSSRSVAATAGVFAAGSPVRYADGPQV